MPNYFCQWNDDIIDYIAQHGIAPEDVDFVVRIPQSVSKTYTTGREIAFGYTSSGDYIA